MIILQIAYILGFILLIPFFPLLYVHGKKVKATIPTLPEAEGPEGVAGQGAPDLKVLALGESTIAGVGVQNHKEGIIGQMAKYLAQLSGRSIKWKILARKGYTAEVVKQKLVPDIPNAPIDLVIIGLGGNDAFQLNSPLRWRRDFEALIKAVRSKIPHCPIVITNMPPSGEFPAFTGFMKFLFRNLIYLFDLSLKKMVTQLSDVYYIGNRIQLEEWLAKVGGNKSVQDFFSDGVHPSPLTYRLWGEEIAKYLVDKQIVSD